MKRTSFIRRRVAMERGPFTSRKKVFFLSFLLFFTVFSAPVAPARKLRLRVGYFPNITHAQALLGMAGGGFARELGRKVEIHPYPASPGPASVDPLLTCCWSP